VGRASSLTWVPAGKKTLPQVPVVSVAVKVQSIPAGWEVTRPLPVPPLASETLPLVAWNWVVTVRVADLVASPEVPMMVDDCGFASELVVTVKVAAVDPAGTVTLPGTVAAVVLLLDSETTTPPAGAEEVNETVPVTGVPPTTVVWLRVSAASDGVVDGGGALTVHPDKVAVAAVAAPSLTATVQSAGAANPARSTLNRPVLSLVPMATPSTVIVRLAAAVPSMRRSPH
jgi:hypothetical protein